LNLAFGKQIVATVWREFARPPAEVGDGEPKVRSQGGDFPLRHRALLNLRESLRMSAGIRHSKQAGMFAKCYARIDRATQHANRLADLWNETALEGLTECSVFVGDDGVGTIHLEPVRKNWPEEMELELGEYLYQLRAALDGAIYASAVEDTASDPPPKASSLEFPICDQKKDWGGQTRKIALLNEGRRRFIELMQPFEEPNLEPKLRIGNFNRCLRFLNELARIDRHRRLHTFSTYVTGGKPQFRLPDNVSLEVLELNVPGNIADESLAKFKLSGWQRGMKLSANPNVDLELSLEEMEAPCWPNDGLPNRLKSIVRTVRMIIAALENDEWIPVSTAQDTQGEA